MSDTGPVAFDTPPEVTETDEQRKERLTKVREKLKQEREDKYNQYAIAMGLVSFFTWVRTPYKRFVMLHAYPNRAATRRAVAATRSLQVARKPKKGTRTTLQAKRAAARRVEPANE